MIVVIGGCVVGLACARALAVRGHGVRTALIYDSAVADSTQSFTYAQLLEKVAAFAGALRACLPRC